MIGKHEAAKAIAIAQKYLHRVPRELTGAALSSLDRAKTLHKQGYFDFAKRAAIVSLGWSVSSSALNTIMPEMAL